LNEELTIKEWNLLSVAYKNVIGAHCAFEDILDILDKHLIPSAASGRVQGLLPQDVRPSYHRPHLESHIFKNG